jgi:ABC-2 type transport system permease protein
MSTSTLTPRAPHVEATADAGVSLRRVITSEWIKFRTLRSSWYTLGAAVAALIVIALIIGYVTSTSDWSSLEADDRAASSPLRGYFLGQLFIGVLGVLFVAGEYGTGMIRSTFAAVPKRLPVVAAKFAVFGLVALAAMTVSSFIAFFGAQAFLSGEGHAASLSDPGALRAVAGVGVYLALIGILGGALGWIIRSTAGAIAALVGVLLVVPVVVQAVPTTVTTAVAQYLPADAGGSFLATVQAPDTLGPWAGLGVLVLWVAAALAAAAVVVRRRDA